MAESSDYTGAERAAMLLMSLGEDKAAEIMRFLKPKQVQAIGTAMATIANVSRTNVSDVVDDFMLDLTEKTGLGMGNEDYLKKVLIGALGEDKANGLIDRILLGRIEVGGFHHPGVHHHAIADIKLKEFRWSSDH